MLGFQVAHSEEDWQRLLTPAQYATLRQAVTEAPRSSPLYTVCTFTFPLLGCCCHPWLVLLAADASHGLQAAWRGHMPVH